MKTVELVQGSDEWLKWRNDGIGASDAPVIEKISPYKTLRQLYYEKKGLPLTHDEGNEFIFDKGHKTEKIIRDEFQKLVKTEVNPLCIVHEKYDFLRASLDGFDKNLGVLEGKLVGAEVLKRAKEFNEIPAHHMSQMQHQFAVLGTTVGGQWYGHDGKKNGVLIQVKPNMEYMKRLLDIELQFWDDLKTGRVPALSEMDYLEPEDLTLLKQLRDAKELAENAQAQFESLKELAVNTYGGHPKIAGAGVKLFRTNRKGTLNILNVPEVAKAVEAVKENLEESYLEKFRGKSVESWSIRIEGPNEKKGA